MKTILFKRGKTGRTALALRKQLSVYSSRSLERGDLPPHRVSRCIRWGSTEYPNITAPTLNSLDGVALASNKLKALHALKSAEVSVPWFTDKRGEAVAFFHNRGVAKLVGRTTYHQGGSNFNICDREGDVVRDNTSSHWLELIPIAKEYRVHVFQGEVIGVSRKTDEGVESRITNRYTRNHHNGWRFIRCDLNAVPERLKALGVEAVTTLGLDFGAVDVILSDGSESTANSPGSRKYYVLEVNSAPSIEVGSTIMSEYLRRFKQWLY